MVCTTVVKKTFNQQQYIVKQYFLPKKATEYNMIINKTTDIHVLGLNWFQEESDVEWKFARSVLYLEYMGEGEVLPVPLNLARIPRSICEWMCDCGNEENYKEPPSSPFNDIDAYDAMSMPPNDRNGVEVGIVWYR